MGVVDYLVFHHRVSSLRRENEFLSEKLDSLPPHPPQIRRSEAEDRTGAPAPKPAIEPLFAHSMPQTQVVTTGSPEFEAVKTRIGEVMAQNVVLQTQLRETEGLRARLRELEPAIHAARSNMVELEALRKFSAGAQQRIQDLETALNNAATENQILHGQVAAIRQAMSPFVPVVPVGEPAVSSTPSVLDPHVNRPLTPTPTPPDEGVGHDQPMEGKTATPVVASPSSAATAIRDRPTAASGLKIAHVVPQRDPMGRQMLTQIEGLTALHQAKLFAAGIGTFADVSQTSPTRLREIVQLDPRDPVDTESWVRQATQIAYGLF